MERLSRLTPCSLIEISARKCVRGAATTFFRSKTIKPFCKPILPPPSPLRRTFPPYQQRLKAAQEETATEFNKGHGRKEQRTLTRTTLLNDYLDWPDIGQVFRLERKRTIGTLVTVETVYGITSLTTDQANAADLLNLV